MEEPAFAALANLRVCAEMPGAPESFTLSEYYSIQGPLSPCSPAPTESYGGRQERFSQALILSTITAGRGRCLLRRQSMSSTDRHGHQRPRKSELHCPSTAESAWQEVSAPNSHRECQSNPTIFCGNTMTAHLGCHLIRRWHPKWADSTAHRNWPHFFQDRTEVSEHCLEQCSAQWCGLFASCC